VEVVSITVLLSHFVSFVVVTDDDDDDDNWVVVPLSIIDVTFDGSTIVIRDLVAV
jgi:hypothetical protein